MLGRVCFKAYYHLIAGLRRHITKHVDGRYLPKFGNIAFLIFGNNSLKKEVSSFSRRDEEEEEEEESGNFS